MYLSEEESKNKFCHIPKFDGDFLGSVSCIDSDCMAWRTKDEYLGYCGLVGKPDDEVNTRLGKENASQS